MSSYNLLIGQPYAQDMKDKDEIFETCLSKVSDMVGLPKEVLVRLVPEVTSSCANISHLAQVMYVTAQPLDLDRIAPPRLAEPLYGVVSPVFIVVGFVLNVLLLVLLVRQQIHSPTSVFLGGMAVVDSLTGVLQLPFLLYSYAFDKHGDYPSMTWCEVYWYMCRLVPMVMHTASLWLTTLLALQRYLGVSRSSRRTRSKLKCVANLTRVLCSVRGAVAAAVSCVVLAAVLHALQAAFLHLVRVEVVAKDVLTSEGLHIVDTCSLRLKDESLYVAYNRVLTLVRLVLAELCPCVLIGTCNLLLVRVTRRSSRYRRHLVQGHRASMLQESRGTRRTTAMLLAVTSTALLAELFVATILVMEFSHSFKHTRVFDDDVMHALGVVSNFTITVTLPANFLIYCGMGGRFRRLWNSMLCARCRKTNKSGNSRTPSVFVVGSSNQNECFSEI